MEDQVGGIAKSKEDQVADGKKVVETLEDEMNRVKVRNQNTAVDLGGTAPGIYRAKSTDI